MNGVGNLLSQSAQAGAAKGLEISLADLRPPLNADRRWENSS
jgi:hypothetical protein